MTIRRRAPQMPDTPTRLTLRAQIRDISPPIWRTLVVPSTLSLNALHLAIQVAFGWANYHLYEFSDSEKTRYCPGDPDDDFFFMQRRPKSTDLSLATLGLHDGSTFGYLYDFGDNWVTDLNVVSCLPLSPAAAQDIPLVTEGARSGPPEDSGGSWGYEEKLQVLGLGKGQEYEELREWIGDDFDPERFDLKAVNRQMKATFRAAGLVPPSQKSAKLPKKKRSK